MLVRILPSHQAIAGFDQNCQHSETRRSAMNFHNKTIAVTDCSSGLGAETALRS